ncbi:MAG: DUF3465 domain-containing protein [Phycisphaerales bacterium]|nr:DUF3465 domain-containing protein [Phycisphaerales bacterium]MCB9836950.1 DUF3465 domain-containing protein [Phycisphaera sp.]
MKKKQQAQLSIGGVILVVVLVAAQQLLGINLLGESKPAPETHPTEIGTVESPIAESTATAKVAKPETGSAPARISEDAIRQLIDNETSGEMVTVEAEIVKVLPDDNDGSRHQRLLLALETGGTVLVSHNIDLAPRVPAEEGDVITVHGQYEWNDRGGVIHWTHHDPKEWREGGWIELEGERYE